ncbi:hypothetical protein L7F22_034291 [Adiantum nelumboides]|nr:hypothetical protein [Adiantum nelumboides]
MLDVVLLRAVCGDAAFDNCMAVLCRLPAWCLKSKRCPVVRPAQHFVILSTSSSCVLCAEMLPLWIGLLVPVLVFGCWSWLCCMPTHSLCFCVSMSAPIGCFVTICYGCCGYSGSIWLDFVCYSGAQFVEEWMVQGVLVYVAIEQQAVRFLASSGLTLCLVEQQAAAIILALSGWTLCLSITLSNRMSWFYVVVEQQAAAVILALSGCAVFSFFWFDFVSGSDTESVEEWMVLLVFCDCSCANACFENENVLSYEVDFDLESHAVGDNKISSSAVGTTCFAKLTPVSVLDGDKKALSPKINKKLSPKSALKRNSPSKAIKKALSYGREVDEPISDNFSSQLALVPSLRVLCISELSDAITFRFAFEGKVLCRYGMYKTAKASYACQLKADLIDRESKNTITFVVNEVFLNEFVECFDVGDFVRIEGAYVKRKVWKDGGTSKWDLYANASTLLVKAESFECCLCLYLEHRIRELLTAKAAVEFTPTIAFTVVKIKTSTRADGGDSYRLTIGDGPASATEQVCCLFHLGVDYHQMGDALKTKGSYSCVAHNINIFKTASSTLSVVDATLICPLLENLKAVFSQHLSKQVSIMGFGKKVFGTLEIVNINSLKVEYVCESCKGQNVSRQICNPFCYSCGKPVQILKLPSLQAKISLQNGESVQVILQGNVVDVVLGLSKPFLTVFEENFIDLKPP